MTERQSKIVATVAAGAFALLAYLLLFVAAATFTGIPFWHLVAGAAVLMSLPALLYLAGARMLDIIDPDDGCSACGGSGIKHQGALILACPECRKEDQP